MTEAAHVLVPLKRLDGAKTRLAELLTPEERGALMLEMLGGVLQAVRGRGPVTLVSSDPRAGSLAREHGVRWWDDRELPWNDALTEAMRAVVREPVAAVVSADLPLLAADDVEALLAATPGRGIAIARATDGGTNAVSMRPPGALHTNFGAAGSAALHAERARSAGLEALVLDRTGLAVDLDTPEDAERLGGTRAGDLLARLALARPVPA
jgi:2-phospho-L-lactate guanylyltransferase